MIHPATELRWVSDEVGFGVFSTAFIPRGTITWVRDEMDQVLGPERMRSLPAPVRQRVEFFSFIDRRGDHVFCWDIGRYVNHACDPTSRGLGDDAEVAIRDIRRGEQMTSDYAELNIMTSFSCRCGSPRCRAGVGPGDLERYFQAWDEEVRTAVPDILRVDQPLWALIESPDEIRAAAEGRVALTSRLSYRWRGITEAS